MFSDDVVVCVFSVDVVCVFSDDDVVWVLLDVEDVVCALVDVEDVVCVLLEDVDDDESVLLDDGCELQDFTKF